MEAKEEFTPKFEKFLEETDKVVNNLKKVLPVDESFSDRLADASLQVEKLSYQLETIENEYNSYLDKKAWERYSINDSEGTITWISADKRPNTDGIYLVQWSGKVVLFAYYDKEGRWMEFPSLDDMREECIEKWAHINH